MDSKHDAQQSLAADHSSARTLFCRRAGNNAGATTQTFCLRTCCRAGTTISEMVASRNALPSSALVVADAVAVAAEAATPANSSNKAATARVLSLHMPKHYSGHVQPIYNGPVIEPYATRYAMRRRLQKLSERVNWNLSNPSSHPGWAGAAGLPLYENPGNIEFEFLICLFLEQVDAHHVPRCCADDVPSYPPRYSGTPNGPGYFA